VHEHRHDHHDHDHPDHDHHDHDHHGHAHHHSGSRRALTAALILNGGFLVVEAIAGFWTGSLALLSDAAHMVSDVAALALALVTAHLVLRPATSGRTFGLLRAEILGAFVNAVALFVACIFIFKEAIARLLVGPPPLPGLPMLVVATIGLAINLGSALYLWRSGSSDLNVRGALVHMMADALGSVGAMIAAFLTLVFDLYSADAVVSMLVGVLVLYSGWGIFRDSSRVLLEFAPSGLEQDVVAAKLAAIDGVAGVHELHVWSLGSGQAAVTAHLVPAASAAPYEVLKRAEHVLHDDLGIQHTTLQVDPNDQGPCSQEVCPILPRT
jgi:cobalt-zinc-cadmium efflux system protein